MGYVIVFLCIFNVVMWIVFLRNFKKLFTTDNIIEETKAEYNKLVQDFNKNTDTNLTILDDRIRTLKALVAEADKKIRLLNEIEKKGYAASALSAAISGAKVSSAHAHKKAADAYTKSKSGRSINPESSYGITEKAGSERLEQGTLFDEPSSDSFSSASPIDTRVQVNVNSRGESWAEVPVVVPEVYMSEKPVFRKKDKKSEIVSMYDSGMSVEDIAVELKLTDTEVQFALSLENRL